MWEISLSLNVAYSLFRWLISFRKAPWYCLVWYVQSSITTTRGPLKLTISQYLWYMEDYFVLYLYSQYRYGEWSLLVLYLFILLFGKMDITYHCTLKYKDILIFLMFQIKISSIIFFPKFSNLCFLSIICHNFWGSQRIP